MAALINMPILKDFRQTKVITLPSFPDSKVEIFDSLLVGDMSGINYGDGNQLALAVQAIPRFIKSWNFTDENGKDLPINEESIKFLKEADAKFLLDSITEFNREIKKKIKD